MVGIDRPATGITTGQVIAAVEACQAVPVAIGALASVSRLTAETFGVPVYSLGVIDIEAYPPNEIPDSWRDMPIAIDKPLGHGHEFMTELEQEGKSWTGGYTTLLN